MPRFSAQSEERLATCDERLQRVMREVVKHFDCTVLEGHRGQAAQDEAFRTGRSKKQWPNGEHNKQPSMAVDVAPYPINWKDEKRFYYFAGYVMAVALSMDITLRWGGDWDRDTDVRDQTFFDLVHFEIVETG